MTETFDDLLFCNNNIFIFTGYDMPDGTIRFNRESKVGEIIAFRTCDGKYIQGELEDILLRIGVGVSAIPARIDVGGVSYFTTIRADGDSQSIRNTTKINFLDRKVRVWYIKDEIGEFL